MNTLLPRPLDHTNDWLAPCVIEIMEAPGRSEHAHASKKCGEHVHISGGSRTDRIVPPTVRRPESNASTVVTSPVAMSVRDTFASAARRTAHGARDAHAHCQLLSRALPTVASVPSRGRDARARFQVRRRRACACERRVQASSSGLGRPIRRLRALEEKALEEKSSRKPSATMNQPKPSTPFPGWYTSA